MKGVGKLAAQRSQRILLGKKIRLLIAGSSSK
jgi:hypothetical protein